MYRIKNKVRVKAKYLLIILLVLLMNNTSWSAVIVSVSSGNWSSSAWPKTNRTGTISSSVSSAVVTGTGTSFTTEISIGSIILTTSDVVIGTVASIQSNTSLTLTTNAAINNSSISYNFQGVGPGDAARISSGHTITINGDYSCMGVTFLSGTSNSTLKFDNNRVYNFTINGGLIFSSPTSDNVLYFFDIGQNNVTTNVTTFSTSSALRLAKISVSTGSFKCKANMQSTLQAASIIESTSSSTFTFQGTVPSVTLSISGTGSTFIYNGNLAQTIRPATYYNLTIGGANSKTSTGVTVTGTFTIDSISTISVAISYGSNAKLKYNTAINRNVSNLEWPSTFSAKGGVEIANTGQITLNEGKTLARSAPLVIKTGARLNTSNYTVFMGGNFINNGTFSAGSSNITLISDTTQNIGSISTSGDFTFSKTGGSAILRGAVNVNNFYVSGNNSTLKLGTYNHIVNNIFYLSSGVLNLDTSSIELKNEVNYTGGTLTANKGTIIYSGNDQNIIPVSYYNLSFIGNGTSNFNNTSTNILNNLTIGDSVVIGLNGNINVDGNLNILIKGIFFANADTINVGGNITIDSLCYFGHEDATIIMDGNNTQTFYSAAPNQHIIKNLRLQNGTKIFNSDLKVSNEFIISENTTLQLGTGISLEIAGPFSTFNSSSKIKAASCGNASNTLTLSGNSSMSTFYFETGYQHFKDFYLPKTGSDVTFNSDFAANGQFNFTNGSSKLNMAGELNLYGNNLSIVNISNRVNASTNFSLRIGNYTNCGFSNTNSITIPNNFYSFYPVITENLIIDVNPGVSAILGTQSLYLTSKLEIRSGSLLLLQGLTLASSSTRTARVLPIPTGSTVSGDFTVERFIPGGTGKRKWRLISSPVNVGGSITLTQFKDDITVTGPSGGGFDVNPYSNAASIRFYNESISGAAGIGWTAPPLISMGLTTGSAVEVFVRGSRGLANQYLNWTVPDDAIIDFAGALNYGDLNKSLLFTNNNYPEADGFNLIGNPYASPINFDTTNWVKTNIKNQYWSYNPTTGSYGIYDADLHTGVNGITRYIAPCQGFFVKATSSGASITFKESVKCSNTPGNTFFKQTEHKVDSLTLLRIILENDSADRDETIIYLSENGNELAGDAHDAAKFYNDALNIYSTTKENNKLAINETNFPKAIDTINLSVWSYLGDSIMRTHHQFNFEGISSLQSNYDVYLLDKFTKTIINIKNQSTYDFYITGSINSYGNDRFKLIIKNNSSFAESGKNSRLMIYPNPTTSILNIVTMDISNQEEQVAEIFNISGLLQMKKEIETQGNIMNMDVSSLSPGVYFLKINEEVKYFIKK